MEELLKHTDSGAVEVVTLWKGRAALGSGIKRREGLYFGNVEAWIMPRKLQMLFC